MKLFTANNIRKLEAIGFQENKYSSLELMNRAANEFARWIQQHIDRRHRLTCLCGKGNNGADGLVIGEKLASRGYTVKWIIADYSTKESKEFTYHYERISKYYPYSVERIKKGHPLPNFSCDILIDGLFGNGLSRPLDGVFADLVDHINERTPRIFAIDVPSGLPGDHIASGPCIHAQRTFCFEFPKLSFFFKENANYIGIWDYGSIGLDKCDIADRATSTHLIDKEMITQVKKKRKAHSHKGDYGQVHLYASSNGMAGAGILAAKAAIRTGCGLCTLSIPIENRSIFQTTVPEAMVITSNDEEGFTIPVDTRFTYGIGPGIGTSESTRYLLNSFLDKIDKPLVLDADALNIIATEKTLLGKVPANSILTPHPKEFERLAGNFINSEERLTRQINFSQKHQVITVVKDHYTTIVDPAGNVYINITGNPGMATGGSGDVLTGMITSLLAQAYTPLESALMGVYIHGRSADIYAENNQEDCLIASDIIDHIPLAFKELSIHI